MNQKDQYFSQPHHQFAVLLSLHSIHFNYIVLPPYFKPFKEIGYNNNVGLTAMINDIPIQRIC